MPRHNVSDGELSKHTNVHLGVRPLVVHSGFLWQFVVLALSHHLPCVNCTRPSQVVCLFLDSIHPASDHFTVVVEMVHFEGWFPLPHINVFSVGVSRSYNQTRCMINSLECQDHIIKQCMINSLNHDCI